ncbi:MAG: hypothetical protein J6S27_00910, partial [Thermoguttaceae bacterium]|nr:hypothetical protein [Thermoguttaceae bacterium]
ETNAAPDKARNWDTQVSSVGSGGAPAWKVGLRETGIGLLEIDGKTVFCYAIGNQIGWYDVREAVYDGTADQFFAECFPDDAEK